MTPFGQCHQVVLVVELVEASLFPHVWVWHVWPMHQVVPVAELVKVKPALFPQLGVMRARLRPCQSR